MTDNPFDDVAEEPGEEPRLHPILSNEDFRAAQGKARERIERDRKAAAMKDVEAREVERLKLEDGFSSGIAENDEIVDVTIDVPGWAVISGTATGLLINGPAGGRAYHHGHSYAVPRHIAVSLRESMFNMWRVDNQVEGRDIRQSMMQKRNTLINARSGAVANAPARFDA